MVAWCNIDFNINFSNYYYNSDEDELSANPLYLGARFFLNNKRVRDLVIPEGVTTIKKCAFFGCNSLTSVEIPRSVTSIEQGAFENCSGLTSVYITDVTAWCNIDFNCVFFDEYVYASSFSGATNPLYYGANLFLNDVLVQNLVISDNITTIKNYTFFGCSSLTSVEIGNSVTSIGGYAFSGCRSLTSVEIGNSVTSIVACAFVGCRSLTLVTIGNGVTSIGNSVFENCTSLTTVTIGENVEKISSSAFLNCSKLSTINSLNPIPPVIYESTFGSVYKTTCVLNVPINCKIEYQLENYWKDFLISMK